MLTRRGKVWHVHTTVSAGGRSERVRTSTKETDKREAKRRAHAIIAEVRARLESSQRTLHKTFAEAADKWLDSHDTANSRYALDAILPYVQDIELSALYRHHPAVEQFISDRMSQGVSNNTINRSLEAARAVLNAASEWREDGVPWLPAPPKWKILPRVDKSRPGGSQANGYSASPSQINNIIKSLPEHMVPMVRFALHTGCREQEVLGLRWTWRRDFGNIMAFEIPAIHTKSARSKLVICNSVARECVEAMTGLHDKYVFVVPDHGPINKINNHGWQSAVRKAGMRDVRGPGKHFRVHDLRTTFASWLRECGVGREDRKVLLGHATDDLTTHYSHAEVSVMAELVERIANMKSKTALYVAQGG